MTPGDCEPLWLDAGLSGPTTAWVESPATSPSAPAGSGRLAELASVAAVEELTPGQAERILHRIVVRLGKDCDALAAALKERTHRFEPHPPGPGAVSGCAADSEHGGMLVCCEPPGAAVHRTPDVVLGREDR